MDHIIVLPMIFKVAKTLYDTCKQVKANKKRCQRLGERVNAIVTPLQNSSADRYNETIMEKALQNLLQTLNESVDFVQQFTDASALNRFFNNTQHQLKFEALNTRLSQHATDLNLMLNITSKLDREEDMADRQEDLNEILSKLDEIARGMANQQEALFNQTIEVKNEFNRRFDSFKFHLKQDVASARNPNEAKRIEDESKLFLHIPGHDLKCEALIGQGGFADVFRGTWLSQSHRVAIKTIRITYLTENLKQSVLDEITAMYKIRYDHVLGIFGACIEPNYYALVVEYMSLGSLFDVLHKKEHVLSWTDRWSIAFQMTKSVNHLHTISIIHRDIKSLNFLMDNTRNGYLVKISDFGLAKIRQETSRQTAERHQSQASAGTLQWKAPELLEFSKPSTKSDIYSLGVVFWELTTGCVPYDDVDEAIIIRCVQAGQRLKIPGDVPSDYRSIITKAWSQEPSERPTSQELIAQLIAISPDTTKSTVISNSSSTTAQPDDTSSTASANSSVQSKSIPVADISNEADQKCDSHQPLPCQGRRCVTCGRCSDWEYTGEPKDWQWIRHVRRWNDQEAERWRNGTYYTRFKPRKGAKCNRSNLYTFSSALRVLSLGFFDGSQLLGHLCDCASKKQEK